jgi:hypothetical protein
MQYQYHPVIPTDIHGAGRGKPEWMMMYEMAMDESKPQQPIKVESKSIITNP